MLKGEKRTGIQLNIFVWTINDDDDDDDDNNDDKNLHLCSLCSRSGIELSQGFSTPVLLTFGAK